MKIGDDLVCIDAKDSHGQLEHGRVYTVVRKDPPRAKGAGVESVALFGVGDTLWSVRRFKRIGKEAEP